MQVAFDQRSIETHPVGITEFAATELQAVEIRTFAAEKEKDN